MAKVKVQIFDDWGRSCLREIRGLKEGTILEGRIHNTAFEFKWNGEDAVLWLNSNCRKYVERKHRVSKGYKLDIYWYAENCGHYIESAPTKQELLATMKERGYDRDDYEVICRVSEYNETTDLYSDNWGEGGTREEALDEFWTNFEKVA